MIKKGLILLPFWANLIVKGKKTWEIRSRNTKIRGRIGIIASKLGVIVGETELVDSFPLTKELFEDNRDKHCIDCEFEALPKNYRYVWVVKNSKEYIRPVPYTHPQGAVIWVNL